jgi:hypothetical protein
MKNVRHRAERDIMGSMVATALALWSARDLTRLIQELRAFPATPSFGQVNCLRSARTGSGAIELAHL